MSQWPGITRWRSWLKGCLMLLLLGGAPARAFVQMDCVDYWIFGTDVEITEALPNSLRGRLKRTIAA